VDTPFNGLAVCFIFVITSLLFTLGKGRVAVSLCETIRLMKEAEYAGVLSMPRGFNTQKGDSNG